MRSGVAHRTPARTGLLGLAVFLSATVIPGQETPGRLSSDAPPFTDHVAVDIVNVEVYVTNRSDEPVLGLTRDDFVVFEDGKPVEIVNFYRAEGASSADKSEQDFIAPEADTSLQREASQAVAELSEEPVTDSSQRLYLIVFVDNWNIHPLHRNRVFSRLRGFLRETVTVDDQVMVASYDRSLHVRQPFTSSAETVNRALLDLEGVSGSVMERESERRDALKEIFETQSLHNAQFRAKQFADHQYHEMQRALDGLREMVDSLAGLPGRKMLLHLSDGIPMVPGQDLYQAIQQEFADISSLGEAFSRDLSPRYLQVIAQANSNRISFYTIDAGGLRTRSGMSAENETINSHIPVSMAVDGVRAKNLQGSLRLMANRTGGRAILNTNDVTAGLERMARDFQNYYSLGYRAPTTDRGRYHRIEVRLKESRRGLKVRHRDGYRDKSIETRIHDAVRAYAVHGYQTNPLGVTLEVGEQRNGGDDQGVIVPVRVRVPMDQLVLLPRGDIYQGRLMIYFGATDEKGRDAPMQELPFDLRIPASAIEFARNDEIDRVIDATMRPGPHRLVVAVRDEIGDTRSVVGRPLMVDRPDTSPP